MRPTTEPEGGESLIELLVSITLLGIGVAALLTGMGTAVTTSGLHTRQAQQVESVRNFADAVAGAPYVPCAAGYAPAGFVAPAGYTLAATVTRYADGAGFSPTCPASDQGAQEVEITITQTDSRVRGEQFVLVKRQPCTALPAPPSYSC